MVPFALPRVKDVHVRGREEAVVPVPWSVWASVPALDIYDSVNFLAP